MPWRGPLLALLLLLGFLALMLYSDRLPATPRDPAPVIADRILIHAEPQGLRAISAVAGIGDQLLVDGDDVWVTYTLSGFEGSSLWVAHSKDGGKTFEPAVEASAILGQSKAMHGSLAMQTNGTLLLAGVTVAEQADPGATGTTAIVLLELLEDGTTWAPATEPLVAEPNQSVSNPLPVALPDGRVVVVFQETRDRTRDRLCLWVPDNGEGHILSTVLPVDDDASGAPKGSFAAVATGDRLHVAYTDGRDAPQAGLFLRFTSAPLDTLVFAPSERMEPVQQRFWQSAPQLLAHADGTLILTATKSVARFQSAAWRDKLGRHKVGGLHEVQAWSREPQVWQSGDSGQTWETLADWTDHTAEVRTSGVMAIPRADALHLVWMENRPVTEDPNIRLVARPLYAPHPSASAIVNDSTRLAGVEPLLGAALNADGRVLILYRDALPGQPEPQELILARTAPLAAQSHP